MTIDIVLDTVSLQHLLRKPGKCNSGKGRGLCTLLDEPISRRRLEIGVDSGGALIQEWRRTCGDELITLLVTRWSDLGGLRSVNNLPKVPNVILRKLRRMGFVGVIDKLIIRIAITLTEKQIVSNDSDFWDPSNTNSLGNDDACVARLVREHLGVCVILLPTLFKQLGIVAEGRRRRSV